MKKSLQRAIAIAGSQSALARAIGITPQAIKKWVDRGHIPPLQVLAVERATGLSREILRPDIYPPDLSARPVRAAEAQRAKPSDGGEP